MARNRTKEGQSGTKPDREAAAGRLPRPFPRDNRGLARRARGLEGRFRSGNPDLAGEHDRFLDDEFGE